MDYTKLPIQLIYRTRKSLEEFTDNNKKNEYIVNSMLDIPYLQSPSFKEHATECFNAAYYICTLILVDEHPEWSLPKYCDIAFCNQKDNKVGQAISLSLVRLYLFNFDNDWHDKHKKLVDKLDQFLQSHWIRYISPLDSYSYKDAYDQLYSFDVATTTLSPTEFALRKIDKEAIEELQIAHFTWTQYTDYYKHKNMLDIVFHIGKTEEEMSLLVGSLRHDAENFYTKDNPYYESVCNRLGEIEQDIYYHFHAPEDAALMEAEIEELQYLGDIRPYKARIAELEAKLNSPQQNYSEQKDHCNSENAEELNRLLAENEDLKLAVQSYKDQGKGLTAPEAAIMITAICFEMNQIPANGREGLAPIIEFCWGKSSSTSSEALRRRVTKESAEKLACKFEPLTPKIARLIRELPQKLEERNLERLMQINPNVNK